MRIMLRHRRNKKAPAIVYYTKHKNLKGHQQICVMVECGWSGVKVGPTWGHSDNTVRRALAMLTRHCDCPARFHRAQEYHGQRVVPKEQSAG